MSNEGAVADGDPPLILEMTAGVDEHLLAYRQIFAAVGIKGRKQGKRLLYRFTGELGKEGADFLRFMVTPVDFCRDLHSFLRDFVHVLVDDGAAGYCFPLV